MKRYTISQLEAFVSICKTGSFSATADTLNVTQPTISLRISELETGLGVKLFQKSGRGTVLTEAGKIAKHYAEQGLGFFEQMENAIGAPKSSLQALRMGSIEAVAFSALPKITQILRQKTPYDQIEFTVATGSNLLTLLEESKIELALLGEPVVGEGYWCEPLGELVTKWVSSPVTLPDVEKIGVAHLAKCKILTIQPPSRMNSIIHDWYARVRVPTPSIDFCTSLAFIVHYLAEGEAVSVLPTSIIANELRDGALRAFETELPLRSLPIYLAGRSRVHRSDFSEAIRAISDVIELMH
jgi:DNA-binding transcriptional LysR family regulator